MIVPAGVGRVYPFSAIVGQERMRLALILNAIEPRIGGVLIRGEKGTAKSTAVRGLASLIPRSERGCSPLVTLPLNATEDMVVGGLDFSETIRSKRCVSQPGLLARAHGGILYVDEVNLLDDHLVDVILDAASSGINVVEREGMTFRHPSRFTLVGTMNPEEGALRPQLLDRFGLCVEVTSERDMAARVELVERRGRFELDPAGFFREFEAEEKNLSECVESARKLLPALKAPRHVRAFIGELTRTQNVAGHRADLVIERAACANAARQGKERVETEDVLAVAEMALTHRRRDAVTPPPPPPPPPQEEENRDDDAGERPDSASEPQVPPEELQPGESQSGAGSDESTPAGKNREPAEEDANDRLFEAGEPYRVKSLAPPDDRLMRRGSGRRSRTRTHQKQGRYVRSRFDEEGRDLALDATLRAAAPHQAKRRAEESSSTAVIIRRRDWRGKVREKRIGCFILFVVDASGSMGARGRMAATKGAILSLLLDAYQKRDRVAMISFRRKDAEVLLPPTASVELAARLLGELRVGGRTPLSAALAKAYDLLHIQLRRDPNLRPMGIVITDGKSNVSLGDGPPLEEAQAMARRLGEDRRIHWIVVDTEDPGIVRFDLARRLAWALGGGYFRIDGLRAADLVNVVKGLME